MAFIMGWLKKCNAILERGVLYVAGACLAGLGIIVVYGVVLRYVFNASPPYVEQLALLLVIAVAMFGAAATVREAGHIGLDSLVNRLPKLAQFWCGVAVDVLIIVFAVGLFTGSVQMSLSTRHDMIPTLGISEASRYIAPIVASVLIALFSLERLLNAFAKDAFAKDKGVVSWN
ncbi:TRAP transporter small permease [Ralstonia sp. SET104]|uniref:TRAP transporter small permease n=1 Tax=Ralstonia sp. SET104 TaxID=2448774 RepID=UPI000FFA7D3E|nr:TRAP transporter small permease [Ralstonia sp. SET104]GCB05136.1 C4-dicarboxylate ABC transporter permease [Ralstonia sp. SET104]